MAPLTLSEYLTFLGFPDGRHPFASVNARDERTVLEGYFVPPPYFETLWGSPDEPKSAIVLAPTGAGKTALAVMLDERASAQKPLGDGRLPVLTVLYDDFARLGLNQAKRDLDDHLTAINYLLTIHLISTAAQSPIPHMSISNSDRLLIRYAFARYVGGRSPTAAYQDLERLKTPWEQFQSLGRKVVAATPVISLVATVLELGAEKLKAGLEFSKSIIELRNETRDLTAPPETDFIRLVDNLCQYYQSIYIIVDRVDETHWTQRDATSTYNLVHPLVANLNLLDRPERHYAFKFFLWDGIRSLYRANAREDRIFARDLEWKHDQLIAMLNSRIQAFSDRKLQSINELFDLGEASLAGLTAAEIIVLFAGTSPRAIVTFCKYIVDEHLNITNQGDARATKIGEAAIISALIKYATEVARRLIPDDKAYREITSLGRVVFSSKVLANEIFRGNKPESVQSKLGKWKQRFDVFQTIGNEVSGKRGFPTEIHAFTDVCVAFLAANIPLGNFLGSKVRRCASCEAVILRDFEHGGTFRCTYCPTSFELPKAIPEEEQNRQDTVRKLAKGLSRQIPALSDIRTLCKTASLNFGDETFTGTPFLIWTRVLQYLIENDESGLRSLLEVLDDSLPPDSEIRQNALVDLYSSLENNKPLANN
ncbi:hypothetical protein [Corallococcus sp. AB018]|uniref:P-loop ATPase, Sll1717 family n=1 Tax=Corallococcus sp. AB018 TaxID=2316715 RepID=UPI000F86AC45|nr:hypothetical protein [Corallococcus sp. AB018]